MVRTTLDGAPLSNLTKHADNTWNEVGVVILVGVANFSTNVPVSLLGTRFTNTISLSCFESGPQEHLQGYFTGCFNKNVPWGSGSLMQFLASNLVPRSTYRDTL
jgi:hypothetical protein